MGDLPSLKGTGDGHSLWMWWEVDRNPTESMIEFLISDFFNPQLRSRPAVKGLFASSLSHFFLCFFITFVFTTRPPLTWPGYNDLWTMNTG
jgi:hypothetical protein